MQGEVVDHDNLFVFTVKSVNSCKLEKYNITVNIKCFDYMKLQHITLSIGENRFKNGIWPGLKY